MAFSIEDTRWMASALRLADKGRFTTDPNPRVGCVLVKDGQLLAEGFHARAGEPHAERNALNALTNSPSTTQSQFATCYVTLEPCSHTGRTGPCADALIAAGITRVVVAMQDPNPQVAGQGIKRLRDAGMQVDVGLLSHQAQALNLGFISRFTRQRPYVRVKLAMSLDGRTAMASGESQWITGPQAREDVQQYRARSSAIITGSGTCQADNPSLTVRPDSWPHRQYNAHGSLPVRQPLRVLVDSQGRVAAGANIITAPGHCRVVCASESAADKLTAQGLDAVALGKNGRVDLPALMQQLAAEAHNEAMLEAGPTLAAAFLQAGLVDELVVYQAPVLLGQKARPLLALDLDTMAQKQSLQLVDERRFGKDRRFVFRTSYAV